MSEEKTKNVKYLGTIWKWQLQRRLGEEQDGARDRCQDGPRHLGHSVGRQKARRKQEGRISFRIEK